jgi:hypothetical protein
MQSIDTNVQGTFPIIIGTIWSSDAIEQFILNFRERLARHGATVTITEWEHIPASGGLTLRLPRTTPPANQIAIEAHVPGG